MDYRLFLTLAFFISTIQFALTQNITEEEAIQKEIRCTTESILNTYKKSIELNPQNEHGNAMMAQADGEVKI